MSTAEEVSKLQDELETMRPLLEEAVIESTVTMEKIAKDTVCIMRLHCKYDI